MNADDARLQQARHLLTTLPTKAGHDLAYEFLNDYLREYPEDADAWYLAGQSATRPVEAIACLERAMILNPEHMEAGVLLAGLKGEAEVVTYPTKPDDEPGAEEDTADT